MVKKQDFGHILIFLTLSVLIVAGACLTYDQIQADHVIQAKSERAERNFKVDQSVIDTLRFLTDPAYEYTKVCSDNQEKTCESLSKTVMTVEHKGLRDFGSERTGIKEFPANASVNFMMKTYSLSRETDSCSTTYYVTVESFDALLETQSEAKGNPDYSTCKFLSPEELLESLGSEEGLKMVRNSCRQIKPI